MFGKVISLNSRNKHFLKNGRIKESNNQQLSVRKEIRKWLLKKAKLNSGKLFECTEKKEPQSPGITSDKLILHSGASTPVLRTLLKNYSPQRSWPLIGIQRQPVCFGGRAQDREVGA